MSTCIVGYQVLAFLNLLIYWENEHVHLHVHLSPLAFSKAPSPCTSHRVTVGVFWSRVCRSLEPPRVPVCPLGSGGGSRLKHLEALFRMEAQSGSVTTVCWPPDSNGRI